MAITRLERKGRKNKSRAKARVNTIQRLNQKPVIKNVDVEAIKAEFEANSKPAKAKKEKAAEPVEEVKAEAAPVVEEPKEEAPKAEKAEKVEESKKEESEEK